MVDTTELLLAVLVHPAELPDGDSARLVLAELTGKLPWLRLIGADDAYCGALSEWVRKRLGCRQEIVSSMAGPRGFEVLPRRLVVERTLWAGWGDNSIGATIMRNCRRAARTGRRLR